MEVTLTQVVCYWGNNLKRILSFSCSPFLFLYTYDIIKQKQKNAILLKSGGRD